MLGSLRRSFAAKLVALEVGTILVVSISLAALLISARLLQTRALEQSVATKAVDAFRRDLDSAGKGAASSSQLLANYGWWAVNMVVYPPVLLGLAVLTLASFARRRRARVQTVSEFPDPRI